jgi:1-acyl-sn-glycerol-3-phosphate acyltransferase
MSVALDTPIIPIAHNAGECWPKFSWIKKPGVITLSIGPLIHPNGREAAVVHEEMKDWIEGEMLRLPKAN